MSRQAREVHLLKRPEGLPQDGDFRMVETTLGEPADGQALVENLFMSVDPYMRGRMRAEAVYAAAYELNKVMYGGAVGRVAQSRAAGLSEGDYVLSNYGWRDAFIADARTLTPFKPFDTERLSLYLGALGMPGLTAYVGLKKFGEPKSGETVFVSAASGAVGANVCQIAKRLGCSVVGSAGSAAKVDWLRKDLGVEGAINYRECDDLSAALAEAAPDGVDVYFENVGGEHLRAALNNMNPFGRIAACGMISTYNEAKPGPDNLMLIVGKKLRMQGFIVSDHGDMREQFLSDMESWLQAGEIETRETVVEGLDKAVAAFQGLFSGDNFGKMIVRV